MLGISRLRRRYISPNRVSPYSSVSISIQLLNVTCFALGKFQVNSNVELD